MRPNMDSYSTINAYEKAQEALSGNISRDCIALI